MRLPKDPLTPASKVEVLVTGIASAVAGIAFLVFAALTSWITYSNGRMGLPPVAMLISVMVVLSIGFFDVAFAIFRTKTRRRKNLLSNATLYFVGGFLLILPTLMVILGVLMTSKWELTPILTFLSMSSLGLLAIRLARIRSKNASIQQERKAIPGKLS
jgi:biotin transporter BioY